MLMSQIIMNICKHETTKHIPKNLGYILKMYMLFSFVCYISLCIILLCLFQFTRYVDVSTFRLFAYILYTHHVLYIHVTQSVYVSAPLH